MEIVQKQLDISCLICGRPLTAIDSCELHVGPVCRKRHNITLEGVASDLRGLAVSLANQILDRIAREGLRLTDIAEIADLGLVNLGNAIGEKLARVRISETEGAYEVRFAYDPVLVAAVKSLPYRSRRFTRKGRDKYWVVEKDAKADLWTALCKALNPGTVCFGPQGPFETSIG